METYFKNIYRFLFEPTEVFEELKDNPNISQALCTLIWVNTFLYSLRYIFTGDILNIFFYLFSLLFYLVTVIVAWCILGLFFEYIAKIFDRSGRLKVLLYLSSFSIIPWIFLGPLELLKNVGNLGYFFGVILELFVYFWTIFLYCKSLQATYNIRFSRSLMLIFLPFIGMFFALCWTIGFFTKLGYIFTV